VTAAAGGPAGSADEPEPSVRPAHPAEANTSAGVPTGTAPTGTPDLPGIDAEDSHGAESSDHGPGGADSGGPARHRIRGVLAIRSFRRLWAVTSVCAIGDWLSLLALSALATHLTSSYQAQSFALGGVVATKLLPAMLFGPLAGALADKLDRRKVMVTCDTLRCLLFFSIPVVGSLIWLFIATFLIEVCSLFWIPAKDSSIPNLLRRPDQVETANQLGLVMTYGVAVVSAAGLFSALSSLAPVLGRRIDITATTTAYIALVVNGAAYAACALIVWFRIPEISGRSPAHTQRQPGLLAMLRDGFVFVGSTPLIRGLVIGIIGAFAAGGAVVACAKLYATSLGGGDTAYGLLFVGVFVGLATGMGVAPRLARRLPRHRLFGASIVGAGLALVLVAMAPHLVIALALVACVGMGAGIAFLTGLTIIGLQVENAVRGRTVAFVQSLVRVDLLASMALVPVLVGLVRPRALSMLGHPFTIDGTRTVLLGAGVIAAVVGVLSYRQMDDRRGVSVMSDLRSVLRRRPDPVSGLLIAVEGSRMTDTTRQAAALVDWLRAHAQGEVLPAGDPRRDEQRVLAAVRGAELTGQRARAMVAAAVRAETVERRVRPALAGGALVVMEQYVDSALAQLSASGGLSHDELEGLGDWATGRLRPDVTVLLDHDPSGVRADGRGIAELELHWKAQRILTEMAAANPDRYVVVDADGEPGEVAERIRVQLRPLLTARGLLQLSARASGDGLDAARASGTNSLPG
jgi:dTMP kinase